MMTPERRVAVITGGAGAIGSACVDSFVRAGWDVWSLDKVVQAQREHVKVGVVDLADSAAINSISDQILAEGPIHALVNNAAHQLNKPLIDTSDEDWNRVLGVNVTGPFRLIRQFAPGLIQTGGAIVNVASVHAFATSVNVAAYATSKGALVALTRAAAVELGPVGVRCNAVVPGAVDTPMLREGLGRRPHPDGPEGNRRLLEERTPLGRIDGPEVIAESVLFLADGNLSPYTTGQELVVDGGALAKLSTE